MNCPALRTHRNAFARCLAILALAALAALATAASGHAAEPQADSLESAAQDAPLMGLSLEDLGRVKITSASKKEEPWFQTAAAVFVITSDDIRRSGARSIPQLLRVVPGLEVANIDGSKWAVAARGFNGRFSTKLLVLVDGHSIYTPLFTGVFWDAEETILDDIERIEVIRGPGATLWGTNAVNGVINIITKDSGDTQGALLSGTTGTSERGYVGGRAGGTLGTNSTYRVFGLGFTRKALPSAIGGPEMDDWRGGRGGFRVDWDPGPRDHVCVGGAAVANAEPQGVVRVQLEAPFMLNVVDNAKQSGEFLLARWTRQFDAHSELHVQANFDHTDRTEALGNEQRHTLDIDVQHNLRLASRHDIVWGANWRLTSDRIGSEQPLIQFTDEAMTETQGGLYVQDDLHTSDRRAALTLGVKVEKASFGDASLQPNARVSFAPSPSQAIWGSVARALRTPSRGERTVLLGMAAFPDLNTGLTVVPTYVGSPDRVNEELVAYEVGWRTRVTPRFTADLALFRHHYENLLVITPGQTSMVMLGSTPYLRMPLLTAGTGGADEDGAEVALWFSPTNPWRLRGSYTYALLERHDPPSAVANGAASPGLPPRHRGVLESQLELTRQWSFDQTVRYVDPLPKSTVPAYTELDLRLSWRPAPTLKLTLEGANLLHDRHAEYSRDVLYLPAEVERSGSLHLGVRF